MPLTPEAEAYLATLAAGTALPLWEMTVEQARNQVVPSVPPFEVVERSEDRRIPGPAGDVPIRITTPKGSVQSPAGQFPVVVFLHGGGWVLCDVEIYDGLCRSLANAAEAIVISVDYRRAPEFRYPAAVHDAYAVVQWAANNAESFGGDPLRIGICGDSAGGNLAAATCLLARDQGHSPVTFQALIYPITDCDFNSRSYQENAKGYGLTRATMRWFWDQYVPDESQRLEPYASPLRARDLKGLPPTFLLLAEYDPLRTEGEAYGARLQEAGIPVESVHYAGLIHGFLRRDDQFPEARVALDQIARAFRRGLSGT